MPSCRGFTLLEVIVALGIVAVGILGVSRAMSGYVETTAGLEQRVVASWVAANRLEYLRITRAIPVAGETRGSEQMGGRIWYLRETTSTTADPLLYRIDVVVYTDSEQTDEAGSLTGYLLDTESLTNEAAPVSGVKNLWIPALRRNDHQNQYPGDLFLTQFGPGNET